MSKVRGLLDDLWKEYVERVVYARQYKEEVLRRGGTVANDHIAFRTLNVSMDNYPAGVRGLERVFKSLGYGVGGSYRFPDKHLTAYHYEHEDPDLPRIFISQLEVYELSREVLDLIQETVADATDPYDSENLKALFVRPWTPPSVSVVKKVNEVSQYGAWTLLHGNAVNHFTAYVNKQNVKEWPDIDTTVKGLSELGVPMKPEVEGLPGSKLRQTATKPVIEMVSTLDGPIEWPYAYYEIAERGYIEENGERKLFTGFLGSQATHLFEMTKQEK
jgi:hypothetical protein